MAVSVLRRTATYRGFKGTFTVLNSEDEKMLNNVTIVFKVNFKTFLRGT